MKPYVCVCVCVYVTIQGDSKSDIWQQEKNLSKAAKVLGQLKSQLHTRETTAKQKVKEKNKTKKKKIEGKKK